MSDRTKFDDLARRKLEELEFHFEGSAWRDMERTLRRAQRRGAGRWWIASALLLLIGTGTWWTLRTPEAEPLAAVGEAPPIEQPAAAAATGNDQALLEATTAASGSADVQPSTAIAAASPTTASIPSIRSTEANEDPAPAAQPAQPRSTLAEEPETSPARTMRTAAPATTPEQNIPASEGTTLPERIIATTRPTDEPMEIMALRASPVVNTPAEAQLQGSPIQDPQPTGAIGADPLAEDATAVSNEEPVLISPAITEMEPEGPIQDDPVPTQVSTVTSAPAEESPLTALADTLAPTDSTTASTTGVQDSLATALAPPPAPPMIDPRAPWEISALAGMFLTSTTYSGMRSEAWESDVKGLRTVGYGAELMHMGPHIGFGGGLHYSTYSERIDARELSMTETTFYDSNYFVPVDTTILVVHGTYYNGQWYYQTHQLDTTIHVLESGTFSNSSTYVRRLARERTNTLSYLELPLLFDAHLVQGPWALGVRGGPTVGVLQGRRGSLPNEVLDGYTELEEEAFRELMIGWTARAYIRYRFSDAWSIGLEPTARGQLFNGMEGDGLTRRTSAFGGFFSVNYRLR